jgi:hypothetical protein
MTRQEIIDLIHNEYDAAPAHYKLGDNWDDGSGRIADVIMQRIEALEQELRNIDFATLNQCARIEQLEAALREIAEPTYDYYKIRSLARAALAPEQQARVDVDRERKTIRLATIEECAMVAINAIGYEDKSPLASFVANAIRALSPEPPSHAIVRIEQLEAALREATDENDRLQASAGMTRYWREQYDLLHAHMERVRAAIAPEQEK